MTSILDLVGFRKWRARLRAFAQRVEQLEKSLRETDAVLDVLVTDAVFHPGPAVGMNGQQKRKEIIEAICRKFQPQLAVETGTFLGNTTGYLATTLKVPVISCELRERYHHVARRLLREIPGIDLRLQDSRGFLRELALDSAKTSLRTFFYLDAHWYDDLPLVDELEIIGAAWPEFVAVIDDFQVPRSPDYGYDDYGPGRRLDLSLISEILRKHSLKACFPRAAGRDETGECRGCCIVLPQRLSGMLDDMRDRLFE